VDRRTVQPAGERDHEAGIQPTRKEHAQRLLGRRQAPAHSFLEQQSQVARLFFFR
jgi:hypothetical protein